MRTFIRSLMPAAFIIGSLAAGTTMASATTPVNFGQCHAQTEFDAEQAPGATGTGPMTASASGTVQLPRGFSGWQMCAKS